MGTQPGVPEQPEYVTVAPGDDGADEALPSGGAPWWLLPTRWQRLLAVAVLVAAVGVGVARLAAHRAESRRPRAAAPPAAALYHAAFPNPNLPAQCAHQITCISADAVPRGTTAAISEFLPGAHERVTYTVIQSGTKRLVYRAVNATSGNIELLVIIKVPEVARPSTTEINDSSPGAAIRYVRRQVGGYEVQVQYTGPPGGTPPFGLALRLLHDPRLFEVT